jgi:diguanylate cyclase (GGDEF)-like protein
VALNLFADVLRTSFRSIDILARLGGDEFMVLLTDIALADVEAMVDRFWANLEQANIDAGKPYNVAASVGISHFESDAISDVEAMIAHSDKAMYSHKNNNVT